MSSEGVGVSMDDLVAIPMRFEEQKLSVDFWVRWSHLDELTNHERSQLPQFFISIISRCIKHLLKYPKQLRLHQHHWHVQVYSDSMENRDCTLDFAVG
jgi:hypothetical protein